ncbi:hypothetical protein [Companilactobacillus ginsenosidimutans]|uniref:Uncharacterized protein n=1 Tax=Companilactobacillus ginsenosidimutans TaxID=1007676 RepID=A0A0H4QKK3_9LACO|nr:hypothetical protein [Companilactobacillus ginsenosidimutans]AKP67243.1 hypothetical protein ABM34_06620 [Companilactobacillus ginsenosidimutans]
MKRSPHRAFGISGLLIILVITAIGKTPFTNWMNSIGVMHPGWVLFFWVILILVLVGIAEGIYLFFTRKNKS